MPNWVKAALGVLISAGIFIGVWAWVVDMHPLRPDSFFSERRECEEQNRYRFEGAVDCYSIFRRREEAIGTKEKWLGAGLGAGGAGLFWLLVWLFYIRPRRRAAESGEVDAPA